MTESKLFQKIIKPMLVKERTFAFRVEHFGLPDLYIYKKGNVLWAEMKCVNTKQAVVKPEWRPGQLAWMKSHEAFGPGSVCLILYYCGEVFFLFPKESYTKEELVCQKKIYLKRLNQ